MLDQRRRADQHRQHEKDRCEDRIVEVEEGDVVLHAKDQQGRGLLEVEGLLFSNAKEDSGACAGGLAGNTWTWPQ